MTDGGLLADPVAVEGVASPRRAVRGFVSAIGLQGHPTVVGPLGAWVLRRDGSAVARLHLLQGDGWLVHGYVQCLPSPGRGGRGDG